MWVIWVLLWKHCLVRRRKYLATLFEYIFPVLYLVSIAWLMKYFFMNKREGFHHTEPLMFDELVREHKRGSILFTPETAFTNQLMSEFGAKLNLSRLDHLPSSKDTGYFPFSNDMALSIMDYSKGMSSEDAIVIFEDLELDKLPKKLKYTIRMKENFLTDEYGPTYTDLFWPFGMIHHEDFDGHRRKNYEAFMRLQWTLDTSYLRLLTGAHVKQLDLTRQKRQLVSTKTVALIQPACLRQLINNTKYFTSLQTLTLQEFPLSTDEQGIADSDRLMICVVTMVTLPFALIFSYLYLVAALYEGKNSGMHELVKMAGVSWETLAISHVLNQVPIMLLYVLTGTLLYKLTGFVVYTGGGYIAVALALQFLSLVALAFVIVYIFNLSQYSPLIPFVIYFGSLVASVVTLSYWWCSILLPHAALMQFWISVAIRELLGIGITSFWSDPASIISVGKIYLIMALQTFFLAVLAWYLSKVRPGNYGQALPWNFICIKDYWCMQPNAKASVTDTQPVSEDDQQYFEKAPAGLPVGIKITDVYKSFGEESVLNGVNLSVYSGEITVLLGNNGAGKTTLINIITGVISATSGHVLVEGKDTVKQSKEVRKLIGLCPQENIFFAELTLLQHAMFFAMVKGKSCSQSRATANEIFTRLYMSDKANALPDELSGGMKRRAQLACAMAGEASVLMLDEPTSGLDVETRRELWDLLLSLRGNRTVLLTTHFMEEADALGDRITTLHHGRVRCHATAMFLKRAIGTGYRLSFTTIETPQEAAITSTITAVVPDATVRDRLPNGITYNLPAKDTARFPDMFAALEDRRSELRIDTIGVGKSSLDDVFVKLCSDEKLTYMEELDAISPEPAREKVTGSELCARQFAALLLRQWRYIFSNIWSSLLKTIVVVLIFWMTTVASNNDTHGQAHHKRLETTVSLDLDLYATRPERRALVNADKVALKALRAGFSGVEFKATPDVVDAVFRAEMEDDRKYLVGIELNDTSAKALYTTTVRDAAPVALNALSNALAACMLGSKAEHAPSMLAEPRKLTARYHPLRGAYVPYNEAELKQPKKKEAVQQWAIFVTLMSLIFLVTLMRLPCVERAAGTRYALIMAGAPRALVWGATLVMHIMLAALICALPVVVFAATVDKDHTINQHGFLVVLCVLLILGYLAFLGLMYLVCTLARQAVAYTVMIICIIIFTLITPMMPEPSKLMRYLKAAIFTLMPAQALSVGVLRAGAVARVNAHCSLNRDRCPALNGPHGFEANKCCESSESEPWSYWSVDGGAGWALFILTLQTVTYLTLTQLVDGGALRRQLARLRRVAPPSPRFADAAVLAEAEYVAKAIKMSKKEIPDALLCHNLQKNFAGCCGEPFFAVKGISFSVKKGECFGLLGVNGAGKSTTFSMLTGQVSPTAGDIFANGYKVGDGVSYMRTFSYCPQFSGVENFLTGRQNLALLLTMRGLQASSVATVTAYWIEEVDLSRAADKPVSSYSGGMARRLVAAAALCQAAPTAVLDEPTAGVDPLARRRMHVALLRARRNRSLIVASHSMDEMEALCQRIAIMSGGELRALGSAAALKAQYGKGYSVVFKLTIDQNTERAAMLEEFKGQVHSRFESELRDEHQGSLSYYLKGSLRYSELFSQLEQLREQFPALVEDYTVTEATLEEVFLTLAKEAHDSPAVAV